MAKFDHMKNNEYRMHLEKYHFETAECITPISCKNCSFKTGSQTVYNKHFMFEVKHCRPDKIFAKCDYCDLLHPVAYQLKQHVKLFHADKLEGKESKIIRLS